MNERIYLQTDKYTYVWTNKYIKNLTYRDARTNLKIKKKVNVKFISGNLKTLVENHNFSENEEIETGFPIAIFIPKSFFDDWRKDNERQLASNIDKYLQKQLLSKKKNDNVLVIPETILYEWMQHEQNEENMLISKKIGKEIIKTKIKLKTEKDETASNYRDSINKMKKEYERIQREENQENMNLDEIGGSIIETELKIQTKRKKTTSYIDQENINKMNKEYEWIQHEKTKEKTEHFKELDWDEELMRDKKEQFADCPSDTTEILNLKLGKIHIEK